MTNFLKTDTLNNRIGAFYLAQKAHLRLSPQERAASRVAVWVEDGCIHWSGQWTGQPPEGELTNQLICQECLTCMEEVYISDKGRVYRHNSTGYSRRPVCPKCGKIYQWDFATKTVYPSTVWGKTHVIK